MILAAVLTGLVKLLYQQSEFIKLRQGLLTGHCRIS
jgi:hypothetical protein